MPKTRKRKQKHITTRREPRVALVTVPQAESLEDAEDRALATQMIGSQDWAEAYLYCYDDPKLKRKVIGANVDFVRQITQRVVNKSGKALLDLSDDPPVIENITINNQPAVRVITSSINRKTGERKWAVVEEVRNNQHAAYIALQKAERRALEGHPAYDRKRVAAQIRLMLVKQGMNPNDFVIAGATRTSAWSALFAKAKEKGVTPEQVRAGVRTGTGKGLSEAKTGPEISQALHAADKTIQQGGLFPNQSAQERAAITPEEAAERDRLLHHIYDALLVIKPDDETLKNSLKLQYGVETVEQMGVPQLRTFHSALQRRLEKAKV